MNHRLQWGSEARADRFGVMCGKHGLPRLGVHQHLISIVEAVGS